MPYIPTTINPLGVYVQAILPVVYDDSLSYLEFLGRIGAKLNELIAANASQDQVLLDFLADFDGDLTATVTTYLDTWMQDGTLQAILSAALVDFTASEAAHESNVNGLISAQAAAILAVQNDVAVFKAEVEGNEATHEAYVLQQLSLKAYQSEIDRVDADILALSLKVDGYDPDPLVNLFNKATVTVGSYINYTNGVATVQAGYEASDFIAVTPGKLYQTNINEQLAFYTRAQAVIVGAVGAASGVVAPYNAAYVRISVKVTDHDTATLIESDAPNLYSALGLTSGKYVNYLTGNLSTGAGYNATAFLPIDPGARIKTANNEQLAFYTGAQNFISGAVGGAQGTTSPQDVSMGVISPATAKYVRLSVKDAELSAMAFYDTTRLGLSQFPVSELHVGMDADCTFTNITNAIAYAKANPTRHYNIRIRNGIYEEVLNLVDNDNISLIGENVKQCIVINKTGLYANTPLNLSGEHLIKNLTFIANHDSNPGYSAPYAYAVHYDAAGTGVCEFENCEFYSYQNAAIGIGMHQDQTLRFKNCVFYKDSTYDGGCVYWHNAVASGVTNQRLIFEDCVATAKQGFGLKMDDANIGSGNGLGNDMTVTFIRSLFYSEALGKNCQVVNTPPIGSGTIVGNVKLDPKSYGNNIALLNV